ncbi:MAG TPA: EamA family transporter [Chitinophagaceae bacterium]|nr:EamA family transporter [Chitinophagaceae bacterium]
MSFFDINKSIISPAGKSLKRISVLNPLTIHKKGVRAKAIFCLALVCLLWGTTWIASKEGVRYMPALQMAGIRQLLGGLCYVLFFIAKGERWPEGKEWRPIFILSFLNFLLANGLSTWGLKYISSGLGAIIGAIFPLWLVVIGLFSARGKMPGKAILGLLLGFGGVCVIFSQHLNDFLNIDFRFGILLSLAATWAWAFGTIYTKKHAVNFNPYFSIGLQMVISGIALTGVAYSTNSTVPVTTIPWQSWIAIVYLVVFGSVISFIAYLYALQNLSTGQASLYAYVNPIVAVLLGWLIFSEKLTAFIAIGGLVTLSGVYLVNKAYKVPVVTMPEAEGV